MVFKCELAIKLRAKDVEVGTSSDRNPRQDQVTMGRLTAQDLLTTKALVLSTWKYFIYQEEHHLPETLQTSEAESTNLPEAHQKSGSPPSASYN